MALIGCRRWPQQNRAESSSKAEAGPRNGAAGVETASPKGTPRETSVDDLSSPVGLSIGRRLLPLAPPLVAIVILTIADSPHASASSVDLEKPSNAKTIAEVSYDLYRAYIENPEIMYSEMLRRESARKCDLTRQDVESLLERIDYGMVIMRAIDDGDAGLIKKMLEKGDIHKDDLNSPQVHRYSDDGTPWKEKPLVRATLMAGNPRNRNALDIMKLLLESGADPNDEAECDWARASEFSLWDDRTPIYYALQFGDTVEPLKLLIAHHADVNRVSEYAAHGNTNIFCAPVTPLAFLRDKATFESLDGEHAQAEKERILLEAGAKEKTSLMWDLCLFELAIFVLAIAVLAVAKAKVPYFLLVFGAHLVLVPAFMVNSEVTMWLQQFTGKQTTYWELFVQQLSSVIMLVLYAVSSGVNWFCTAWLAARIRAAIHQGTERQRSPT